jgi:hypothetical protein
VNNLYEAIAFVAWTIVASYLALALVAPAVSWRLCVPGPFRMGVFAFMPGLDLHGQAGVRQWLAKSSCRVDPARLWRLWLKLGGRIHVPHARARSEGPQAAAILSLMPPIQRLELVTGRLLLCGFILLTTGLAVAPFGSRRPRRLFQGRL